MIRHFGFSVFFTVLAIILAGVYFGPAAMFTAIILIAVETAFSFDNAVINAKVLSRLSRIWQQLFLTVGILIAVVGMRFVFPILMVAVTADLSWRTVLDLALNRPDEYAERLDDSHVTLSSFGGAFLLTLALYFLFDDKREYLWIRRIEQPFRRFGGNFWVAPLVCAAVVGILGVISHEGSTVWRAGFAGIATYVIIHGLIELLSKISSSALSSQKGMYTGWAAFMAFIYLEVLDASFSFDGVLGAFAITNKVLLIALGLGVGALWVRSLTIYMVRKGTLNNYVYLEHGAHYAILFLASVLLGSIFFHVPEVITGVVGIGVILASYHASRKFIALSKET